MDHLISYDLARGLHIIAVIAWIAGLLIQPRYYAQIAASQPGGELEQAMVLASRRVRAIILAPSMVLAWAFGVFLFATYIVGDWGRPLLEIVADVPLWFWPKLLLVLGLSAYHGFLASQGRKLAAGERKHTAKFWRAVGEAPFLVAIVVVLLATLEP